MHTAYTYLCYKFDEMEAEKAEHAKTMQGIRDKRKSTIPKNQW